MRRFTVLFVVLALLAVPVFGATYGTISATVTDATGAVLPGVTLEATSPVQIGTRTAVTDEKGQAIIAGLVPGKYTIKATLAGFQTTNTTATIEQNTTANIAIKLATEAVSESITVTAEAPLVDTTRSTISEHVTLQEVESLPVGRDYKAYAQLVVGVNVVPNSGGADTNLDPQGKGGNNYADRGDQGRTGKTGSRDNVYYIDGLDVTDMGNGRGTMTFNNEVILEQEIVTSGTPAEFAGGKGFVGNVVTKSGGNEFSGSANYYFQTGNMYEDFKTSDTRLHAPQEDRKDAAVTFGGPIVRDRAWFFVSGQIRENSDDFRLSSAASPTGEQGFYNLDRSNYFGKVTLKAGEATTLIGQIFSDPRETTGSQNQDLVTGRYYRIEDTPETLSLTGQHVFGGSLVLDAKYGHFEEEYIQRPMFPELGVRNTLRGAGVNFYETDFGSAPTLFDQIQKRDQADVAATWFFDAMGTHTLKGGIQYTELQDETFSRFNGGVSMTSLAPGLAGITFGQARIDNYFSASEYNNVFNKLKSDTGSAAFAAADTNHDGVLTEEEFRALTFGNTSNNPYGVNFLRTANQEVGRNNVTAQTNTAFVQDDWRFGQWTVNAGVRMEDWEYIASDGSMILDMDPTFSPRLGLTWDIGGQGRQKITAFYGRYFDPIRTDMVHFGGNISGTVNAEQVFIGNDWYSYRLRGSRTVRDAGFAPNLKNQTQDEYALTYGINFTPTWAFMAQGFRRVDDNLIEDYDPHVYWLLPGYACGATCTGNEVPADMVLTPGQHGYPPTGIDGPVNFYLANLIGAKRRTHGLDLAVERRYQQNWTASFQYSWRDAKGNTNSDANADLQGDFIELDPRQPYMYGNLPGSIDHQVKVYGMYHTPWNLEVGGLAYWNSGAHYTESDIFLPGQYDIFVNHGILRPTASGEIAQTGAETHPSYMNLDAKLRYVMPISRFDVDIFLDIYNVLNNQDGIFIEQSHDPSATRFQYRETRALLEPRRYQAGVRLRF